MIALLLIFFLVIWGGVFCLLGWLMLNLFPKKLQNKLYIAPFALILFVLPVIDEILGSFQFANLCKELPTVEFNQENKYRKIEHHRFLENERIFRNVIWIKQIYSFHVLDHAIRNNLSNALTSQSIKNPYLNENTNKESFR